MKNKIKSIRLAKGIKLKELATRINVSESTMRRLEDENSYRFLQYLDDLSEQLDTPPEDLINFDGNCIQSNHDQATGQNAIIINNHAEKIIEQYEARLGEKDALIAVKDELLAIKDEHIASLKQQLLSKHS